MTGYAPASYGGNASMAGLAPPQDPGFQDQMTQQRLQKQNQSDLLQQQQGYNLQNNALANAYQQGLLNTNLGFQGTQADLQRTFQGQQSGLDRALQTTLQGNQLGFQGTQADLDRAQAQKLQSSQLANNLQIAELPIDFEKQKFNTLFPFVSGALGGAMGGSLGAAAGGGGGGAVMAPGGASSGGGAAHSVYSPSVLQQQVNAQNAKTDQAAGTQQRQNAINTASGGFGSNSPLLQALNNQVQMGAMGSKASQEQQTRFNAAQANAQQDLGATQEQDQANAQFQQNAIQAQGNQLQARSSLIAALAGMI